MASPLEDFARIFGDKINAETRFTFERIRDMGPRPQAQGLRTRQRPRTVDFEVVGTRPFEPEAKLAPAAGARTFTCEACGKTHLSGWTEEEAQAEALANGFGPEMAADDCGVVCDDCYLQIMKAEGQA